MTRREALALLLVAALVLGGRVVRRQLLVDAGGAWREPGWLAAYLPDTPPAASAEADAGPPPGPPPPLDPNTAPADSLVLLPGIGPVLAERIVAARRDGMHFARPEDLQNVKGIGPRLSERLAASLRFPPQTPAGGPSGQSANRPPAPAP